MAWQEGPLQSWYDIHEAMRNELARVRGLASATRPEELDAVLRLTDAVQFFLDILTVHSMHEDGIIFPFMRYRGFDVPDRYREDHHRELTTVYDIRTAMIELRFHDAGQDVETALARVRALLDTVRSDLDAHLGAEEAELIPQCEQHLTRDEQIELVTRLVGETPLWLAPHLTPWMIANISPDHGAYLLDAWHTSLPAEVFRARVMAIRNGVDEARWRQLTERVPVLADIE